MLAEAVRAQPRRAGSAGISTMVLDAALAELAGRSARVAVAMNRSRGACGSAGINPSSQLGGRRL